VSHAAALAPAPLRFRAIPWYDRSVERVIEVAPAHTLSDLHRSLVEELGLDDDHLWAFYLNGEWLDRTRRNRRGALRRRPGARDGGRRARPRAG